MTLSVSQPMRTGERFGASSCIHNTVQLVLLGVSGRSKAGPCTSGTTVAAHGGVGGTSQVQEAPRPLHFFNRRKVDDG